MKAEVASTKEQLTIGLSNRDRLAYDEGLLLVLPKEGRIPITMRDMRFPISVLFFNHNLRITETWDLFPGEVFTPFYKWQFALEVKGFAPTIPYDFARISDGPLPSSSSFSSDYAPDLGQTL